MVNNILRNTLLTAASMGSPSINMWLAFDIGTTGAKAALISADGTTIRSAYRDYETHQHDGWVEQDAADWWRAVIEAAHELDASTVDAIALTGQMQDVILLTSDGTPTRPVILYSDMRAHAEAALINEAFGTDRLRTLTGNTQDAGSLLAKLRWLRTHEPEALTNSAVLLFGAADYIALKLSGIATTDTTTASTTGLLDLETRTLLNTNQLSELQLDPIERLLPSVHAGGAHVGTLTADAAHLLGLKSGIPIYHGPGDAGATTFGAGGGEPGRAYAYIGTSGWIAFTAMAHTSRNTQAPGIFTLAHPRADYFIMIAPLLTAGGNLDWLAGLFETDDYAALIDSALAGAPSHPPANLSANLLYLPYLNGERSPFSDPFARGAFIGLSAAHTRADLCRAVLEGVVYAYKHALDTLIHESLAALTLTGGGTRSPGWCQLFADVCGLPVSLDADAANVGVRGTVLASRFAVGELSDYGLSDAFPSTITLLPDIQKRARHDQQYALFKNAYLALKPIFAGLLT